MNVLDLFSGIGGFSLGLERAGMRTRAFCEIDPYCRAVLRRHWPDVPVWGDIRTLTAEWIMANANGKRIDVICGGFPCQDISVAGKGAGLGGERSGLWSEYARIVGEVRPRYVIVENVAALLGRGIERVLGDLAALGYDAEWHCIPACAIGAPHRRDRVWIVAYAPGERLEGWPETGDPINASGLRLFPAGQGQSVANAGGARLALGTGPAGERTHTTIAGTSWWATEPDVGRVAHGVPARVDRLRALGNAVVPQIPEIIGRAIMKTDRAHD